jgi:N6-adenosine-specific RNA methylase IME4
MYDLILADPPWSYQNNGTRAKAKNHYQTMTLQEIKDYPVPAKDNSILLLWITSPLLPAGIEVMGAWNFTYKASCMWDKGIIGLGNYFRIQHEILLLGTRGKVPCPDPCNRFPSIIYERRTQHSKKPVRAYEVIEAMYPELSKIELFARARRDGWEAIGNELEECLL